MVGAARLMKMRDCPKWFSCSAPICPLPYDERCPSMGQNVIYTEKGERTCYFVTEYFKENAKENFRRAGVGWMYEFLKSKSPVLTKELERSSKTKSRMARFLPKEPSPE